MDTFMSVANLILLAGGAFVGSLLAAVAGFGGAAVLLPLLVAAFGVREAIPILTVARLLGNLSRAWFNRRELDLPVVGWFALTGVSACNRRDARHQTGRLRKHGDPDEPYHHSGAGARINHDFRFFDRKKDFESAARANIHLSHRGNAFNRWIEIPDLWIAARFGEILHSSAKLRRAIHSNPPWCSDFISRLSYESLQRSRASDRSPSHFVAASRERITKLLDFNRLSEGEWQQ
jgi:hypothetical protein